MKVKVSKSVLSGKINAIPSKSYAHRMIIAAALSDKPSVIACSSLSVDITATIDAMKALGAVIAIENGKIMINPIEKSSKDAAIIDCKESGSLLRFVLPVISALGIECEVTGSARLAERPIDHMLNALSSRGAVISGTKLPLVMKGRLTGGRYDIRGDISSQYVTGLLMALPLLDNDSEIVIHGDLKSCGYVKITLQVLESYGIIIEETNTGYIVKGNQHYIAPSESVVDGDWSNSAFWLVAGAVNGDIEVEGLDIESAQGDKAVIDILKSMNADIVEGCNSVRVKKSKLSAINYDMEDIPDLAPIVSVACACADGRSILYNVERLRDKECDRLNAIIDMLGSVGAKAFYSHGFLVIDGNNDMKGNELKGFNDHRMVMSSCILGAEVGDTIVDDAEAVDKSYPNFFKDLVNTGGKIECFK